MPPYNNPNQQNDHNNNYYHPPPPPQQTHPSPLPRPDQHVLHTFTSTFADLHTATSNLHSLRGDYLALGNELRLRMDEYVRARDDAKKWEERCRLLELENYRREGEREKMRGRNRRLRDSLRGRGEKVGEVWRRGEGGLFGLRRGRGEGRVVVLLVGV
ncbi:hypothetical protein Q7P37_005112 [Cladosporium fusiforme]